MEWFCGLDVGMDESAICVVDDKGEVALQTTVVTDPSGDALYFSKSVIPHVGAAALGDPALPVFLHIGVYAYTRAALEAYAALPPTPLELLEGLEQLRFIEHGRAVRVVEVAAPGYDIWELNDPEDVAPIEAALAARGLD